MYIYQSIYLSIYLYIYIYIYIYTYIYIYIYIYIYTHTCMGFGADFGARGPEALLTRDQLVDRTFLWNELAV